ncbi:hypothetical protein SAMN04487900_103175 [Prevotella communis]|uniref:Type IV secretion system putative lipoprotein virB7 n=1 Tax=Prevotella communis TaxID=2913614 RepID=A0A1H0EIC9_9BACT|nr:lipoprotein [Prevotella communis]SDN82049.1 hypothetical protein SAMN04487900_103175 [Prevotella communis]
MKKLFLAFFAILTLSACSCSGGFKHGQQVTVSERCIYASSEGAYDEMTKYCNRRDEAALERMDSRGEIGILYRGDTGVVTEVDFAKVKIRLQDGKEVWVANDFLK